MSQIEDLILISVDDHLIEPPDLFLNHLDAKYLERAPKLVRNDEGNDVWVFGKAIIETAALNAVAGRPRSEYGLEPQSLDEVRPGCYDVHERVKDMDAGGVLASMNFPSFPTFTARVFERGSRTLDGPRRARTTTGTSTSGAAPTPADSSPWACRSSGIRPHRSRDPSSGRQGLPLAQLHGEPGRTRAAQLPQRALGSRVAGVLRHEHGGLDPPRILRAALDPGDRLTA